MRIETAKEKRERVALERRNREIAEFIEPLLPSGAGFTLLVYDFGEGGAMTYVSNARRDDMRKAMREFLEVV